MTPVRWKQTNFAGSSLTIATELGDSDRATIQRDSAFIAAARATLRALVAELRGGSDLK
jgi:hypothetical protein